MSKSLNKVCLIGHVGVDPSVYEGGDHKVVNFTLATTDKYKDKGGLVVESTQWHNLVAFNDLAEIIQKYVRKGSFLYVEGKLKYSKYTKDDGIERLSVKVELFQMQMLDKKKDSDNQTSNSSNSNNSGSYKASHGNKKPMADVVHDDDDIQGYEGLNDSIPF